MSRNEKRKRRRRERRARKNLELNKAKTLINQPTTNAKGDHPESKEPADSTNASGLSPKETSNPKKSDSRNDKNPTKNIVRLSKAVGMVTKSPFLAILGNYEYCDELGNHEARLFSLRYRNNAPSSDLTFDLATDTPIPIPEWLKNPCEKQKPQETSKTETVWEKIRRWASF